jgi:hypothetical protein
MNTAKTSCRLHTLEDPHGTYSLFNAARILFQVIIQVPVGPMAYGFSQLGFAGSRIRIVAVGGDSLRDTTRDCACRAEERFRRCLVPGLTEEDIDQLPSRSIAR